MWLRRISWERIRESIISGGFCCCESVAPMVVVVVVGREGTSTREGNALRGRRGEKALVGTIHNIIVVNTRTARFIIFLLLESKEAFKCLEKENYWKFSIGV
jgi:hypothetical protein